jgi:hypothetical protein
MKKYLVLLLIILLPIMNSCASVLDGKYDAPDGKDSPYKPRHDPYEPPKDPTSRF